MLLVNPGIVLCYAAKNTQTICPSNGSTRILLRRITNFGYRISAIKCCGYYSFHHAIYCGYYLRVATNQRRRLTQHKQGSEETDWSTMYAPRSFVSALGRAVPS